MAETIVADPLVSVVVPVFNEEELLPELRQRLTASLAEIEGGHEIVLVDDGSTDSSPELIEAWAASDERVVLVQLSRNFGMEIAMSAGLDHARGPFTAIMHADLRTRRS